MFDIVAIGESLIDFTPNGNNEQGMQLFARNPGGAPANVLAMSAKLGDKTAFIGKVGNDEFGNFLIETMENANVCTDYVVKDEEVPTTLAIVQLTQSGDRSFSFYRKPGADVRLKPEELKQDLLRNCKIFHFGSVSLTQEPARTATLVAANIAKENGAIISYDPNYRNLLWESEENARTEILSAMHLADIIKVSDEELKLLTGETDLVIGADKLTAYGVSLVIITLGAKGAFYKSKNNSGVFSTYDVKTVDTTGAGDAFLGALLHCILNKSLKEINEIDSATWEKFMKYSNAAGSMTTTKKALYRQYQTKSKYLNVWKLYN